MIGGSGQGKKSKKIRRELCGPAAPVKEKGCGKKVSNRGSAVWVWRPVWKNQRQRWGPACLGFKRRRLGRKIQNQWGRRHRPLFLSGEKELGFRVFFVFFVESVKIDRENFARFSN